VNDETVRAAIARHGDPEISMLTADDGSFVLRDAGQGERFALHHVIFVNVPHPMSVMLAASADEALITSSRPDVVAGVVDRDPGLRAPEIVWDLIRGGPLDGHLAAAELVRPGIYEFAVRDDADEVKRWRLTLSPPRVERLRP
jgi:hypothetical protein